jgi:CheY-like chemotaxis protein/HPt (histidine-containing phosphotransfer) domain-containing protein
VRADPVRLRQILLNLLGNAVKFTERGEVTLTVECAAESAPGAEPRQCELRFGICDTGIGISPEAQTRLFQVFSQADGSTSRRYGGTGLGLAVSKQLAALMGGAIGVDSVPGRGSTFWFTIRVELLGVGAPSPEGEKPFDAVIRRTGVAAAEVAAAGTYAEAVDCRGARVLLAEDNPVNQEIARAMLESAGCRVTTAGNGRAAVDAWRAQRFALVLMDCQMPELDGFEATREIRALEAAAGVRTPVVALTANAMAGDRERCLAAGMDDYLPKPFNRGELLTMLQRWADLAPLPAAAPATAASDEPGSSPGTATAFDPAAFQNALPAGMGVDAPLARKLIGLFVAESAKQVAAIECAAAAADTQALFRAAHSLKSSAASVGASALAAIAKELEALARAEQTGALAALAAHLCRAHARFGEEPAIRDLLAPEPLERNAA